MPFSFDAEVGAALAAIMGGQAPPPPPPAGDVATRRERVGALIDGLMSQMPAQPDVETKDIHVKSSDGQEILCRWFSKKGSSPGSAIVYTHGGGMISLSMNQYAPLVANLVAASGVPMLSVDYRLAPEHRAPTLVHDAYAALEHLSKNAAEYGVDPQRIAVMGDSAGGGIAAGLAHYAKQQNGPHIAKQILVYPMLDDRNLAPHPEIGPYAIWSPDDNKTGWGALLDGREGSEGVSVVDAPGRMTVEEARGLPPTYIDVGQLDIFADEDLQYARTLGLAGVDCELHLIPSVPHAFEGIAPTSKKAQATLGFRIAAIQSV